MRGKIRGALLTAMIAAAAVAHGTGTSLAEGALRFAATPPTTYLLPYFVAKKQGYFQGMAVEEIVVTGDANAMRAVLSNDADVAMIGAPGTLLAIEQGAKIKAVSSQQPVQDYNLITYPGGASDIKAMAGQVFATTGPGNIPDVLAHLLLKKYGVDVSAMQFIAVTGGHAGMFSAVASKRAAGALVNTITAEQGALNGQTKILMQVAQEMPDFGYTYTVVREGSLSDPKLAPMLETMVRGMIQACRFSMEHPDEAADILHESMKDMDPGLLRRVVEQLGKNKVWGVNGGIERETVSHVIELYRQLDLLKGQVSVDQAFDYRFVDASLKALGRY
jgi:NitT/TauT family transport system substrate-binding protein